ncbi:MAG: hypothetical protein U9Q80_04875, partial [Bacillota bacterium]|nr:hypothetical protein [Bacillota bacterium]
MNLKLNKSLQLNIENVLFKFTEEFYIVGGYVRDLVLDIESKDIDIVLPVDFVVMKNIFYYIKKCFPLDSIDYVDEYYNIQWRHLKYEIDIVPMRKEIYSCESHKPKIVKGTFIDDLLRRDFTINSVYVKITKGGSNEVIDPLNGLNAINEGEIIINYTDSFKDDPTRYFRLFIYKNRLGFTVDDSILAMISKDNLNKLTNFNLVNELVKILHEKKAYEILSDLFD